MRTLDRKRFWNVMCAVAASLATLALLVVWSPFGLGPNLGMPFGYYGKLNRVLDRLESLPDVQVRGALVNYDMRLEDFTVELLVRGTQEASVEFPDAPAEALLSIVERWAETELPRLRSTDTHGRADGRE